MQLNSLCLDYCANSVSAEQIYLFLHQILASSSSQNNNSFATIYGNFSPSTHLGSTLIHDSAAALLYNRLIQDTNCKLIQIQ